jgi:hypothetical protein
VLGTCEVECVQVAEILERSVSITYESTNSLHEGSWPEELLSAWDRRDSTHKFKLVCIAHNIEVGVFFWKCVLTPKFLYICRLIHGNTELQSGLAEMPSGF